MARRRVALACRALEGVVCGHVARWRHVQVGGHVRMSEGWSGMSALCAGMWDAFACGRLHVRARVPRREAVGLVPRFGRHM